MRSDDHIQPDARDTPLAEGSVGTFPLHGERPHVGKRVVSDGAVRLRKVVRTKIVNVPVEVRYEEIVVEYVPPGELPPPARFEPGSAIPSEPFLEGEMLVPKYAEEPVVTKSTELIGGVRATKEIERERATVRADVRREDVEVERLRPTGDERVRD